MVGITAAASAVIYVIHGEIDPYVAGPTAIGVFLGASVGSRIAHRIDLRILRWLFVVVLLVHGRPDAPAGGRMTAVRPGHRAAADRRHLRGGVLLLDRRGADGRRRGISPLSGGPALDLRALDRDLRVAAAGRVPVARAHRGHRHADQPRRGRGGRVRSRGGPADGGRRPRHPRGDRRQHRDGAGWPADARPATSGATLGAHAYTRPTLQGPARAHRARHAGARRNDDGDHETTAVARPARRPSDPPRPQAGQPRRPDLLLRGRLRPDAATPRSAS